MAGKVEVPEPTAEENALRTEQTALLRSQREILLQQQKQQSALLPLFADQLGITLKFDKQGNVIGGAPKPGADKLKNLQESVLEKTLNDLLHPEKNPTYQKQQKLLDIQLQDMIEQSTGPLATQNKEIQKRLNQRTLDALEGKLPVDPSLERDIKTQGETLRDRLRAQLGPGYETSSAGIEALQKFGEGADVLRSQARTGQLTLSEQLSLARQGADFAQGGAGVAASQAKIPGVDPLNSGGFAFGVGQGGQQSQAMLRQVLASPLGIAGGLGQVAGGFQMPIGQLMQGRQMQLDANIQNSQNSMAGLGAIGNVFGTLIGLSDEAEKEDLEWIAETKDRIPVYMFTWKHARELGRQVGVMAQDVKRIRPRAFKELFGKPAVDYGAL